MASSIGMKRPVLASRAICIVFAMFVFPAPFRRCEDLPKALGLTSDWAIRFKQSTSVVITTEAVSKDYQRMSLGFVTLTRGPVTENSAPRWQLHEWHNGTMYHLRFAEPTNWTCAPSVALA